jgi:hypothetical protein
MATTAEALRCFPRGSRNPEEYYCPLCRCNKGGWAEEPNARTEACMLDSCLCHGREERLEAPRAVFVALLNESVSFALARTRGQHREALAAWRRAWLDRFDEAEAVL